jgi:hypothetical protein
MMTASFVRGFAAEDRSVEAKAVPRTNAGVFRAPGSGFWGL